MTPPFVLLDNSLDDDAPSFLFETPERVICARNTCETDAALAEIDAALAEGKCLAGFFSYELGYALEARLHSLMPNMQEVPLQWMGVFKEYRKFTRPQTNAWLQSRARGDYVLSLPRPEWDLPRYAAAFDRLKAYIAAGDLYQLNLTFGVECDLQGDAIALYRDLRRRQPVAFGALIEASDFRILSLSPELFFRCDGRAIETRPMKGTAPRFEDADADRAAALSLAENEKTQAENRMIVDLMRNDLGRIAVPAGVSVPRLFHVESYPTLHQMISVVTAEMEKDTSARRLIQALFPSGSVTGAPKIRAMEIARELESGPRGIYTGAIGAFFPDGQALFNVAIRSIFCAPNGKGARCRMGVGGGVLYDSDLHGEYEEALLKGAFLTGAAAQDFRIFETLRYDRDGGFSLLDLHVSRMRASAHEWGFAFDETRLLNALQAATENANSDASPLRVKIMLSREGNIETQCSVFKSEEERRPLRVMISDRIVDSCNPLLLHKTTRRAFFDEALAQAREEGYDEVLFLNERGELTQGSYTNVFVRFRRDGKWQTPPLSSGLLPGTLREAMLNAGEAEERVLTMRDLKAADAIAVGNALRGMKPVTAAF